MRARRSTNPIWAGRRARRWLWAWLAVVLCLLGGVARAEQFRVRVVEDSGDRIVLRYELVDFGIVPVTAAGQAFHAVTLDGARAPKDVVGAPELPRVTRSVIVPAEGQISVRVLSDHSIEIPEIDVPPSKGILPRVIEPASVPHAFGFAYEQDALYPAELASVRSPYLMRELRGVVVELNPFQYNPVRRTLRIHDQVTVEVYRSGLGGPNVLTPGQRRPSHAFEQIYQHHFANYAGGPASYVPPLENGTMLVIAHDAWLSNVAPLVAHKNAIGIPTTAVGVSAIGNDAASIKSYIQTAYDGGNLTFVLLVGDAAQVATPISSGGASDPSYAKLAGSDDYPDILVGRFSAETPAEVDTQVERTLAYEQTPATTQDWFKKAVGIGSDQGPGDDGELDYQHIDLLRNKLLGYGYSVVDSIYDPGAQASAVAAAVNEGRGLINYCGHGSMEAFTTSGFSINDVNALSNDNKLPFVIGVACVTGAFDQGTCFGESWLRATRNGVPIGAIGAYMSSINQSWDPPMAGQDEANDLLIAESHFSLGALCFAGSGKMMDDYFAAGVEMFDTWILFGDPSLRIYGVAQPPSGIGVEPFDDLVAIGDAGGPFTPSSIVYTIHNYSTFAVDWTATRQSSWLALDPASGTLPPEGEVQVTVAFDSFASALGNGHYEDTVTFVNTTDHEGDTTRAVVLDLGEPELQQQWPLDEDPGWTVEGAWAFGAPAGLGGETGGPDPTSGYTGSNVYGYNLQGDYANGIPEHNLTSPAIDCSHLDKVSVKFWRWLGVEHPAFDHASVKASTDGETWTTVWENQTEIVDAAWTQQEIDLTAVASGQTTVYLRWTMGATDGGAIYCGWNIDDIELWGLEVVNCWDADGDGAYDVACGGDDCHDDDATIGPAAEEICDDGIDNDCDGATDGDDPSCMGQGGALPNPGDAAPEEDSGCGCRTARGPSSTMAHWALLAGLALGVRRRLAGRRLASATRAAPDSRSAP
jgi:hypothetical protein